MSSDLSSLSQMLSKHTSMFGIPLWVLILICIALFISLILTIFCIISHYRKKSYKSHFRQSKPEPPRSFHITNYATSSLDRTLLPRSCLEIEMNAGKHGNQEGVSDQCSTSYVTDLESAGRCAPVGSDRSRKNRFSLGEIEVATNGLADENVIGNGDYGVVYRGVLLENIRVAVKRLFSSSDSCQSEDFKAEVEAIGLVRHKNLATLLGYCMEGCDRMLVYEYIDNGNLLQWLHRYPGPVSPLTWPIRMNIIQGMAKGLAYLHEDIEPKIVHGDIKCSNIQLDHQWNPKLSDFGLAKLFGPEWSRMTAHKKGMSGYAAPESAYTDVLSEKGDVYGFGILIMEIVTGRTPVDHRQPQEYLIDWIKSMVANQKTVQVVDPKLPEMPTSKDIKRILLIAFRCVDPDMKKRPKMGDVIHMLEPRNLLLGDRISRETSQHYQEEIQIASTSGEDNFDSREGKSSSNFYQKNDVD